MRIINKENGKKVFIIRNLIMPLVAIIILIWAFWQNAFWGKVIISPFFICAISITGENLFLLLNKQKIVNIFRLIFRISFFVYAFGFLIYAFYYSITTKSYSLILLIAIFLGATIHFLKRVFFSKNR